MEKCQICNIDLYRDITFENIFKINYQVHLNCLNNLDFNNDRTAIPINNNYIYYDTVFNNINEEFNKQYLEFKYLGEVILKNIENNDWSIVIIYSENLFSKFNKSDFLIFFSLSKAPFLFISLTDRDLSFIFHYNL